MHEDLLKKGPHEAPEPETAEEKSKKLGLKTTGGVVAGGGIAAAKVGALGGLGKFFLWAALWNGLVHGGWIGLVVVVAIVAAVFLLRRRNA